VIVVAEGMSKVRLISILWILAPVTFAATDQRLSTDERKLLISNCFKVVVCFCCRIDNWTIRYRPSRL